MLSKLSLAKPAAMELLAPAGTFSAFEAAMEEGADAVYVGAPGFNARSLRRDFSLDEIRTMTRYAHDAGKRLYVAMNSLVKEQEMRQAVETLSVLAAIGPDALIVQDLGFFFLAKKYFPELPLHASTLMSVHNAVGADFFTNQGFERVVLARELSLDEIGTISRESKADLEIFIHGAMCFSYSGLCMFSSMHGGKSSLRGECVQPCRRHYRLQAPKQTKGSGAGKGPQGLFLFSMNDLCGIDFLDKLAQLGVVSLKIEGRLKSVEYVRKTVRAYRLCLDNLQASGQEKGRVQKEANDLLDQAMSRKRTRGFFTGTHEEIVKPHLVGVAGVFAGKAKVVRRKKDQGDTRPGCSVTLRCDVSVGDRLRFQDESSDVRESFTLQFMTRSNRPVRQAKKGQTVIIGLPPLNRKGKPQKISQGLLFQVDVSASRKNEVKGKGRSLSKNKSLKKLKPDGVKVDKVLRSVGWNQGRQMSGAKGGSSFRGKSVRSSSQKRQHQPQWWLRCSELPSTRQRYPVRPTKLLVFLQEKSCQQIVAMGKKAAVLYPQLIWMLPPVIHQRDIAWYRQAVKDMAVMGFCRFQIGHISQVSFFTSLSTELGVKLYADYTVNALNNAALLHGWEHDLAGMLFSLETDRDTLQQTLAAKKSMEQLGVRYLNTQVGMYVFGKPPLFTAKLNATHLQTRKNVVSPRGEAYTIERKRDLTYVRSEVPFVLFPYVREMMAMGVDYFVIDLEGGNMHKGLAEAAAWLQGRKDGQKKLEGNYNEGLA